MGRQFSFGKGPATALFGAALALAAQSAQAQPEVFNFDVPPQQVSNAILEFARQSKIQILVAEDDVHGRETSGVTGSHSPREALELLLSGTGLSVIQDHGNTIILGHRSNAENESADFSSRAGQEVVVITGTNIRGASVAGQNIIKVSRADIELTGAASTQQLLQTLLPQLNGFGIAGQSSNGQYEPRIHSIGGGSSSSTLTLVNGHRIPLSGGQYAISDPSIIPVSAIQDIEILPDGASAVYGSDAVAGVINILTRRAYAGWETRAQLGFADAYNAAIADQTFGHFWNNGSLLFTYSYSSRSRLAGTSRPEFVGANQSSIGPGALNRGGTNFNNYNCYPATISPTGSQIFQYPYNGPAINSITGTTNGICDVTPLNDLLPSETANRAFMSLYQSLNSRMTLSLDLLYSGRITTAKSDRNIISNVAVYGQGSNPPGGTAQINPFFVGSGPGVTYETVSFNADGLFGPGAYNKITTQDIFAALTLDVDLGSEWGGTLVYTTGTGSARTVSAGILCVPCVYLALNGTSNASGQPNLNASGNNLGNLMTVTRALTTQTAFNVWDALGRSRAGGADTSSAVLRSLTDATGVASTQRALNDIMVKLDGPVLALPGGDLKLAAGGEFYNAGVLVNNTSNNATGPSSTSSAYDKRKFGREIYSGFGEISIPIVSPEMSVPLINRLDVGLSGRLDRYSDIPYEDGLTTNSKASLNWRILDSLRMRATWGTSFTAPQIGNNAGLSGSYNDLRAGVLRNDTNSPRAVGPFTIPGNYPGAAAVGCAAGCSFSTGAIGPLTGIQTFGNNVDLKPQIGKNYSLSVSYEPHWLDQMSAALSASVTFWGADYSDVISTSQSGPAVDIMNPGLNYLFIVNPTPEQIAQQIANRTALSAIPANIQYIFDTRLQNLLSYQAQGFDILLGSRVDTDFGSFSLALNAEAKTKFAKAAFPAAPWTNSLNIGNTSNTFSPVAQAGRASLGWDFENYRFRLFVNHIGAYYQTNTAALYAAAPCPANTTVSGAGCQKISPQTTFDLYLGTTVPEELFAGSEVFVAMQNIFDKAPPFVDTPSGYDPLWSNPIGRLVSVGLRKKW
jgi:iron complex outermembrane receptor protein